MESPRALSMLLSRELLLSKAAFSTARFCICALTQSTSHCLIDSRDLSNVQLVSPGRVPI